MEYRLYPRDNGIYYVEFFDENGKRKRISTKKTSEKAAKLFISKLEAIEAQKKLNKGRITFGEYADGFFAPDSAMVARWREHGRILKDKTLASYASNLDHFLMPWFKESYLDEIDAKDLDKNLKVARKVNRSNDPNRVMPVLSGSAKNGILITLVIILDEAVFDKKLKEVPAFKKFARHSKKQNTLSAEELQRLFPFDHDEFGRLWTSTADDGARAGKMFATMSAIAVSCGLRSGEVCALSYEQIIPGKGLVIDRKLDEKGEITLPKMGTEEDMRFRPVPVSDYTFQLINGWLEIRGAAPGLLFTYNEHSISGDYLLKRFKMALKAAGIDTTNRRITFHGLRYTFNTKMKPKMDRGDLHDIVGHLSDAMTDLYDRPIMEERLDELRKKNIGALNSFWKVG
jgi:Phage integrase family.